MSTTFIANLVVILTFTLPAIGLEVFDENRLTQALVVAVGIFANAWVFIGRWRAGGINAFGLRKTS